MKNIHIFTWVLLVSILAILGFFFSKQIVLAPSPRACTEEAKICPDGTAVGRSGPKCEFAPCFVSSSTTTEEVQEKIATLNQTIINQGISITPLRVTGDSRCPIDVQCIQAGTVSIEVMFTATTTVVATGKVSVRSEKKSLTRGVPVTFNKKQITLVSVNPSKSTTRSITPSEYTFEFTVTEIPQVVTSKVDGEMTIGPICPVENIDDPCMPTPEMYASKKVSFYTNEDKSILIQTVTPNAYGKFTLNLPVGNYYVDLAQPIGTGGGVTGLPTTITVQEKVVSYLTIRIDTGIR